MKTILLVLLLFFALTLSAQTPKHEISIEVGPNFYALSHKVKYEGNTINNKNYLGVGYCFGLTYLRNFNTKSTFRTGALYEYLGKRKNDFGTNKIFISTINYLSIPLLYQHQLSKGNSGYYFNTGINLMNCFTPDWEQKPYTFDVGFVFGLGLKYRFSDEIAFGIELRNNLLLTKLWNGHSYIIGRGYEDGSYVKYDFQNHTNIAFSLVFN